MLFWVISISLAVLTALLLGRTIVRGGQDTSSTGSDLKIYRDQLREVERDLARGVVSESEADTIRQEISRRLLDADKAQRSAQAGQSAPSTLTRLTVLTTAIAIIAGTGGLYWLFGAPGYPDLPLERRIALANEARENRISQAGAEAAVVEAAPVVEPQDPAYLDLVDQLRAAVADRPDDLAGYQLLARHEARVGNYTAAYTAQSRVIGLKGAETAAAQDFVDFAELMVLAAQGYVSPEAEAALLEALAREPSHGVARYYSGLLAVQTGRPDIAFRLWRRLLEEGPAEAPWIPPIRAQISELSQLAGVDYVPPSGPIGPTAEDIEAAGDLSPSDRMAMIEGMVSGLAERLATEGGPPADWARLIRAYGVLGRRDAAASIWAEAQTVFPDDANRIVILEAARDAGVSP